VSVVGTEALSVVREPDIDDVVFGTGKEEVALLIEFDLGERPLVSCEKGRERVSRVERKKKRKKKKTNEGANLEEGWASDSL